MARRCESAQPRRRPPTLDAYEILSLVDDATFGVQVYGFDHYVSYAYPGGLALDVVNDDYPKE